MQEAWTLAEDKLAGTSLGKSMESWVVCTPGKEAKLL